ncbi:hypothetical protein K505DRAFT_239823 [Melanomma pulvis-pyrius CBS 109.77]|uniref:Uncharacterized protein n=1 Tax=Melanomma pulvis-pyrius CBS 109.77 TaxID=1314802 RepID=A0A6A6XIL2_9PLEO|nr:hypothetical protein K505DRAFT_239823 [Melanomma pulvis-pyrius CBS 109.77]
MPFYSDFTPQFFDVPESFELSLAVTPTSHSSQTSGNISAYPSFADPLSPSCLLNFDLPVATQRFRALSSAEPPCRLYTFDDPGLLTTPDSTNFVSSTKALRQQFSQRTRSLQQGSLTARMLFSRLTDYTRMMADGKHLPPFIHPPCSLGRDDECPPDSPHRCLPETLAICANLTQMFYSRMPGSNGFVWQQIYTHIRQMRIDYEGYDEQRMLQAVQAAIVYGILCSQCTESVSSDDSTWLAATIETFGIRLYGMCAWSLDVDHVCFTRSKWILVESLRRYRCSNAFERGLRGVHRYALALRPRTLAVNIRQRLEEAIPRRCRCQEAEGKTRVDFEKPAYAEAIFSVW